LTNWIFCSVIDDTEEVSENIVPIKAPGSAEVRIRKRHKNCDTMNEKHVCQEVHWG